MSELERKLLSRMLDSDEIAKVVSAGVDASLFEDITCRPAYRWMVEYWQRTKTAPTRIVMEQEFPTLKLETKVDEATEWMVSWLQERYVVNQGQDAIRRAVDTLDVDPVTTLRTLAEACLEAVDQAGKHPSDTGTPRLWSATDLRPAAQPRWLARNRLPRGAVSLLVGEEGIGKSLLWVWLAAAVTVGKPLPEFGIACRDPGRVVVVVTEDDWSTTVLPRLQVAGADVRMIDVICAEEDGSGSPEFPRDLHLIAEADPVPALVVVDAWLDTVPKNLAVKDPQQARQALHPWRELATTTDAAVLLLTHTNRVSSSQARDKYGATGELRKKARMTLFAQKDDNGHLVVGPEKANGAATVSATSFSINAVQHFSSTEEHDGTVPLLSYVGESDQTASEHVAQAYASGHGAGGRDEVVAWLATSLANGPRWVRDLYDSASEAGFSVDQLKRNKRRVGAQSEKDGETGQWFWRLRGQDGLPEDAQGSDQESV